HYERYRFAESKLVLPPGVHSPEFLAEHRDYRAFFVRFLAFAVTRQNIRFRVRRCLSACRRILEHEHGGNSLSHLAFARENHLPGKSVLVFHPAVSLAEGITAERHKDFTATWEFFPYCIDFRPSSCISHDTRHKNTRSVDTSYLQRRPEAAPRGQAAGRRGRMTWPKGHRPKAARVSNPERSPA